ncbi:MAG: hypothetical protein GF329_17395 [Candidatus Lokiarchaeota archaeon]|nr:hypothetical protein [Candidatus Lokiarchaeota archaeon]
MSNSRTLNKLISKIKNNELTFKEMQVLVEKIRNRLNEDFEKIFHESKNVNIYHNLLKEIGYIDSLLQFHIESKLEGDDKLLKEIVLHLKQIDKIYSDYNIKMII